VANVFSRDDKKVLIALNTENGYQFCEIHAQHVLQVIV
jgi:hypothetical protein